MYDELGRGNLTAEQEAGAFVRDCRCSILYGKIGSRQWGPGRIPEDLSGLSQSMSTLPVLYSGVSGLSTSCLASRGITLSARLSAGTIF